MKRRCVPLRGDHNLLTPDTHTPSGVRLREQVRSEGVASLSGHLSDSFSSESTWSTRPRPAASPTRRLRFEDETETEAEFRYQERQGQRRRAAHRGTGVLVAKPHLNQYTNSMAGVGLREVGHVDQQQKGQTVVEVGDQTDLNLRLHRPISDNRGWSQNRHHFRTEPIRETYIGSITPGESSVEKGGAGRISKGIQMTVPQATPTTDLPINPYAAYRLTTPILPSIVDLANYTYPSSMSPPPMTSVMMSSVMTSQGNRPNLHKDLNENQNKNQEEQGRPAETKAQRKLQCGAELKDKCPSVEERSQDVRMRNSSSSSSSGMSPETTAERQAPPTSSDVLVSQPMRAELHSDGASLPAHFGSRDDSSRLSLRRLLSTVRLSRTRPGSLDRLSSKTRPSISDPASLVDRKSSGVLKKSPSVQSLSAQEAPVSQLKKSLSVQSFGLAQKKKKDRSADYRPAAEQILPRRLSAGDVSRPRSVHSVGRLLQVCSDGTFLLELHRPDGRKFGFIISRRRRGRLDTGVYVEDMANSSMEKLYAGLLAVGDEILEVNGENVSCLSLDQVTHLLIQNPSATVRVLRRLHGDHNT